MKYHQLQHDLLLLPLKRLKRDEVSLYVKINIENKDIGQIGKKTPEFKEWLRQSPGDVHKATCIACRATFTAELSVIKNHAKSKPHLANKNSICKQPKINQLFVDKTKDNFEHQVQHAEIRTAALLAEKNIPFNAVGSIIARDKKCYPDSKIAQSVKINRTKATGIVKFVIGRVENENLIDILKHNKFSIIIDESTDVGTIKNLCICVRFALEGKIQTKFWRLVQVFLSNDFESANKGATAQHLYDELKNTFDSAGIPEENVSGFASDGCNTMFGSHNSVAQRMRETYPGLTLSKCICHSLHLCASEACKELPRAAEDLARDIYNYFKNSSKRQAQFLEFQKFFEVDIHKILRPSQTRWLSLQQVVERILEQWDPLLHFFYS